MSTTAKHHIEIGVETTYMADQSDPGNDRYVFAYTITISNQGTLPARLLDRHWLITDANGEVREVRGEGVVGEHPYLRPGEQFQYTSGAVLQTPLGSMHGEYGMIDDEGQRFRAPIAPFGLSMPRVLH